MEKIQRGTAEISPGLDGYLVKSDFFGGAYSKGEKIVAYSPLDNTCPFGKTFMGVFEAAMSNPQYTNDYKFIAFVPARQNNEFYLKCHTLCIINPQKKEIFYFNGVGPKASEKINQSFKQKGGLYNRLFDMYFKTIQRRR